MHSEMSINNLQIYLSTLFRNNKQIGPVFFKLYRKATRALKKQNTIICVHHKELYNNTELNFLIHHENKLKTRF